MLGKSVLLVAAGLTVPAHLHLGLWTIAALSVELPLRDPPCRLTYMRISGLGLHPSFRARRAPTPASGDELPLVFRSDINRSVF